MELKSVNIGEEIKKIFDKSKMTQKEFGKLLGMQQQNVSRIFNKKSIETSKLIKISNALGFNFFTLYQGDDNNEQITVEAFDHSVAAANSTVSIGDYNELSSKVKYLEELLAEKERVIKLQEKLLGNQ